jgi:hypothetical protein
VAEGGSSDHLEAISETLNYLATLCPEGKVFVQLIYDVATLAGLRAVMGSISSILSTLNSALAESCGFDKELNQVQYLISSAVVEIADGKLRREVGKPLDIDSLNRKAVLLASEVGRLQYLVAFKVSNCLSMAFSSAQALQQALNQLQQAQAQQAKQEGQAPDQPAKATARADVLTQDNPTKVRD